MLLFHPMANKMPPPKLRKPFPNLKAINNRPIVAFDLDHTIIGNCSTLSDRDNLEENLNWIWPPNLKRGVSIDNIIDSLRSGLLRPGFADLVATLKTMGFNIIVYTRSSDDWAEKMIEAIETYIGYKFVAYTFTRLDSIETHAEFTGKKDLKYVLFNLGYDPNADLDKILFIEDDPAAVPPEQVSRLINVRSYDYSCKSEWNRNLTPEFLAYQSPNVIKKMKEMIQPWNIAAPNYLARIRTPEQIAEDEKWHCRNLDSFCEQQEVNAQSKRDCVMFIIKQCFEENPDISFSIYPELLRQYLSR